MALHHPISNKLIAWYNIYKRDLPWRNTKDPYKIWLSEIILQQTQVAQGLSYYVKFSEAFPTIIDLADAAEDQVMKLWQGLGYYSRARHLHAAAKYVKNNYAGQFPKTYHEIKELKGVGDYTAAAIASMAFNLPHAVVDGNVYRVLSRLFSSQTPINSGEGKKEFQLLANELLNQSNPGLHNNALMEFGALWCKPKNPDCENCILQEHCLAFKQQTVHHLPVKDKKIQIKNRYFHYFIFHEADFVYIKKRTHKDIWQNLYEFFLIETSEPASSSDLLSHPTLKALVKIVKVKTIFPVKKHVLSHQHLYTTFYELEIKPLLKNKELIKIKKQQLNHYALPQLINKYIEDYWY